VFEHVDWRIEPGQHWQLTGPNGSGKTCLLNLITGDHPQCYINDIFVCGYRRGSGESIWDIKQHIGYVSSALQWDYRVSISCRNVIISGFYDSIGLYTKATDLQNEVANQWLEVLGLQDLLIEKICAGSESTVIYVNHHAQDHIEGIEHYLALTGPSL